MDEFYKVYGPKEPQGEGGGWQTDCVDCWWCMKPKSVTKENRCYVPIRVQDRIDGSFMTAQEVEDKMTRKWGFFHTWQCALAYCEVHFPHMCFKVHAHAKRNGFMGFLAPTTDPRYTTCRFNPFVSKKESQTYKALVPNPKYGVYMRRVPPNEQRTNAFPDAQVVLEHASNELELSNEFPQCVQDSEQLVDQLETMEVPNPKKAKAGPIKAAKATKATKRKATNTVKPAKKKDKGHLKITELRKASIQPSLDDFF